MNPQNRIKVNFFNQTIPTYMVAGYYLAFFFSLSHNFEGVHMQSDTTRPSNKGSKEQSFLYKQVRSIHQTTTNLFKGCAHP